MTPWEIQGSELINCNCSYGCPCQFNALPTHGNCEAMGGIAIDKGHYGNVRLDGRLPVGTPADAPQPRSKRRMEDGGRALLVDLRILPAGGRADVAFRA